MNLIFQMLSTLAWQNCRWFWSFNADYACAIHIGYIVLYLPSQNTSPIILFN